MLLFHTHTHDEYSKKAFNFSLSKSTKKEKKAILFYTMLHYFISGVRQFCIFIFSYSRQVLKKTAFSLSKSKSMKLSREKSYKTDLLPCFSFYLTLGSGTTTTFVRVIDIYPIICALGLPWVPDLTAATVENPRRLQRNLCQWLQWQ